MSFFKDFKADFSQAMNELMPDSNEMYDEDEVVEEENTKKKDKAAAKAEKQAKRAAKSKKAEEQEDREDRKVKAVRPPKEVPLKSKVVEEESSEDDLGIAPEDMSDQIDELLDNELYSDENDPSTLLQDDMEVNTMDMSVAEMLNQLSEKQEETLGEQLSVDDLLSQLGQPTPMEEESEAVQETSAPVEETNTSVGGMDMGLEELLASISAKHTTPVTEPEKEAIEEEALEELVEEPEEEEALEELVEEPEEEEAPEYVEEPEEEEVLEELVEEPEEEELIEEELAEELEEELIEEPEEEEAEEELVEEPEEAVEEEPEEKVVEEPQMKAPVSEVRPSAPTISAAAQDEDALLTQKLEELARGMNGTVKPAVEAIKEAAKPVEDTAEPTVEDVEPVKDAVEPIVEDIEPVEDVAEPAVEEAEAVEEVQPIETKKDNMKEINENVEDNEMSKEKDVISINSVEEEKTEEVKAEEVKAEEVKEEEVKEETVFNVEDADDETTYVTKATKISGDLETEGSIDIIGHINGNVSCKGKIVIGGHVNGNIVAGELYANNAKVEGDIKSYGSVKVGVGSMIIGGIQAESAVIAGAVNGDIDVKGPVIVDSTAVIMGNIKSRSVQINNGAVIEGFCSQSYSDIDVKNYFA